MKALAHVFVSQYGWYSQTKTERYRQDLRESYKYVTYRIDLRPHHAISGVDETQAYLQNLFQDVFQDVYGRHWDKKHPPFIAMPECDPGFKRSRHTDHLHIFFGCDENQIKLICNSLTKYIEKNDPDHAEIFFRLIDIQARLVKYYQSPEAQQDPILYGFKGIFCTTDNRSNISNNIFFSDEIFDLPPHKCKCHTLLTPPHTQEPIPPTPTDTPTVRSKQKIKIKICTGIPITPKTIRRYKTQTILTDIDLLLGSRQWFDSS